MNSVLKVTILLGCSVAVPLSFAGGQVGVNNQGNGGVQQAIRFERSKDAADARQASKQAAHPYPMTYATKATAGPGRVLVPDEGPVPDSGVAAAIRFERQKDAADARQARIEQQQQTNTAVGNADRRMTGHQ
jgi:hypothetical protein